MLVQNLVCRNDLFSNNMLIENENKFKIPISGLEFRSSVYFITLLKIMRGFSSLETPGLVSKAMDKSHCSFLGSLGQLIPNLPLAHGKNAKETDFFPPSSHPDKSVWLKMQCFLDTRVALRVSSMLGATDWSTRIAALNICHKTLAFCANMTPEVSFIKLF